ncbi:MAG TPA: ATP-binding protein [Thermoanaerobaculia bacterium]|nr:ATP-binding protein [Thermoanaerobaculia bacterium]
MILRSLRWRLAIATALMIAAVVAASGVFSSLTVKRELNRRLVTQRHDEAKAAAAMVRDADAAGLRDALARVHARFGTRAVVMNERGEVVMRVPEQLAEYRIDRRPDGTLHLTRRDGGKFESLIVRGVAIPVRGAGTVYFLPSATAREDREFMLAIDRRLVWGLAAAALLAVLVMVTIFRRVFAPVDALTAGARALASGKLDARVDVRGRDEIAELANAFNAMAEGLERNERARRNMVSDVAHELRTPLTNIRAQIEAAQDGVVVADARFLSSIEEDTALLARLVDDLQQLSLAEAGQLRLELAEIEVGEVIERAMSGLDVRGLAVTRDVAPGLVVRADVRRLVQVLRNLIVNAVAHAETSIRIEGRPSPWPSPRERGEGTVEIRVIDDGPGVPPEHVPRIFDRFYRADASRSRTTGGAGLGLAIAKELVELHGGTIRYQKPAFIVSLPNG